MTRFPLSPGMTWDADVYLDRISRDDDQSTRIRYRAEVDPQFPGEAHVIGVRTSIETGSGADLEDTMNRSFSPDLGTIAFTVARDQYRIVRLERNGEQIDLGHLLRLPSHISVRASWKPNLRLQVVDRREVG